MQWCDLETMFSRLECTRQKGLETWWPRSRSWSRDLKKFLTTTLCKKCKWRNLVLNRMSDGCQHFVRKCVMLTANNNNRRSAFMTCQKCCSDCVCLKSSWHRLFGSLSCRFLNFAHTRDIFTDKLSCVPFVNGDMLCCLLLIIFRIVCLSSCLLGTWYLVGAGVHTLSAFA